MNETPKLIILSENFRGRTFELLQEKMTVGRTDERDICIKDPTVSTMHCTLIRRNNLFYVRDEGSTNGTRINGEAIEPHVEQQLNNSDVLRIGGIELMYDSDDKSVTSIMRTTTAIDINAASGTQTIRKLDGNVGFSRKRGGNGTDQTVFVVIIILLSILVIGMAAFFVKQAFADTGNDQSAVSGQPCPEQQVNP